MKTIEPIEGTHQARILALLRKNKKRPTPLWEMLDLRNPRIANPHTVISHLRARGFRIENQVTWTPGKGKKRPSQHSAYLLIK